MERGNEWTTRYAAEVGRRLQRLRNGHHLTASALSRKCAELGLPLDRNVIAKLETGHRQSVTLDEILVLAAALGEPPAHLAFGWDTAEILPGRRVQSSTAANWFTGTPLLPGDSEDAAPEEWDLRLTRAFAARMREAREREQPRLSAEKLARRTRGLGHEVPRNTIADLESGRRRHISLAEVLVIAAALLVPPAHLVFGTSGVVEAVPDHPLAARAATAWLAGDRALYGP